MKLSPSTTRWVKFGKIKCLSFIAKDMICLGSGCFILFINLLTGEEIVYHANTKRFGEGVSCITGHKSLPVVAFAEKCRFPKIFILMSPHFRTIRTLNKRSSEDYVSMTFSESDYLITLNAAPSYGVRVWNWRNGHTIAAMQYRDIFGDYQIIRCNLSTPVHFAQLQTGTTKLNMWDVAVCGKKCVLSPHKITPLEDSGVYSDILWTTEGTLFVLDMLGHAYALGSDNTLSRVITWEGEGTTVTSFAWFKAGLIIAGPDGEIKHFKKVGEWISDWSIIPPVPLKRIYSNYREFVVGLSIDGDIMSYDPNEDNFKFITKDQAQFNDICLIYPMGEYFVSLQHFRDVTCWEVSTGELKCLKKLEGSPLAIASNPEYPYVGVAYSHGVLELLSVYNPEKLTSMASFNLSKNPLNKVSFTAIGKMIVAANMDIGDFYIIEGIPGSQMQVIGKVEANCQICDYMLVASTTCMRLFTIHVTSNKYICGNKIVRYCIIRDKVNPEVKEYKLETKYQMYSKIYATTKVNRDRVFYVIPLNSKCIHEITTARGDTLARVTKVVVTGHAMKKIILHADGFHAITYAYDGLIIIREASFRHRKAIIMPHYRHYGGVVKAYVDPLGQYVVSLGRDNTLICNSIRTVINQEIQTKINEFFTSDRFTLMFTRPTGGFTPTGEFEGMTYPEVRKINIERYEKIKAHQERLDIMEEFQKIQVEVARLLTKNMKGPDNEKLDIQAFNLDVDHRSKQIKDAKNLCKYTKNFMKFSIQAQDNVTKWVKDFTWDRMCIQGQIITAIFENFEISNYVLLPRDKRLKKLWRRGARFRKLEKRMAGTDLFEPWQPKAVSEMRDQQRGKPALPRRKKKKNTLELLAEEEPVNKPTIDSETRTAFLGSTTHFFIKLTKAHYPQQEITTYFQSELETLNCLVEVHKLKLFFNKFFNELLLIKQKEMGLVCQRNKRLRYVLSELNYFSGDKFDITIEDPIWSPLENPFTLLKVKDKEVAFERYISPAEQARRDARAAEAERLRLLLLADDFRERALMAMMNGVLEIRWEDELRKDVPKPKCMLEKEPEKFNEEDLRAVYTYEEDVKFLNSERERYKKILENEYGKLSGIIRDGVRKFNKRLAEAFVVKIQLDSGIREESLKISRMRLKNIKRILLNEKEQEIQKKLYYKRIEMEDIYKLIFRLQRSLRRLRSTAAGLHAKEKSIEKSLKRDFVDVSPVVQEISIKIFKRRPKVTTQSITSVTLTMELAKYMFTPRRSPILTPDCIEYLKSLETLDLYVNIPPAIDDPTHTIIVKHRRSVIRTETKLTAVTMEIAEAEGTIQTFQKLVQKKKEVGQKLLRDLEEVREEKMLHFHDIELQLIVREGIVEIPRTGSISDFDGVILVSRRDVVLINSIILRAGTAKLQAMKSTMSFRRGILAMEWEHARLKMQIADLHSYIKDIEAVKVSKEIQAYLKSKKRGFSPDKLSFDEEVEQMKQQYIRQINESKAQVQVLQHKISALKQKGKKLQGENNRLNEEVTKLNVDICEFQLERDVAMEKKEKDIIKTRMTTLLKRSKLIKQIQKNHSDILMLQTELELLRLKTYPTLSYTIIS